MRIRPGLLVAVSLVAFGVLSSSAAQVQHGGQPVVLSQPLSTDIPTVVLDPPDVPALREEDAFNEANRIPGPLRFGVPLSTAIDVLATGAMDVTADGLLVARLRIVSPGAKSLGLVFSAFDLPEGGRLFLYDESAQTVLGAYDARNRHPETGGLAIEPFAGSQPDSVIVEVSYPASAAGAAARVAEVVHDYRGVFELERQLDTQDGSGTEGGCPLVDVNCPEGAPFPLQKRATVRTVFSGGLCSASLINNTANDGTRYVYTANHCGQGASTVFRFNYQTAGCGTGSAPTGQTVSGATVLANDTDTDGRLLRITNTIPDNYNPYFPGWSRSATSLSFGLSMHHPNGTPKKLSIDNNGGGQTTVNFQGIGPVKCWNMNFHVGSTEGGSSGGPLFDQNGRLRGTLTGGPDSPCSISYYGRFHSFWNETSIAQFLDPLGTGATTLDGFDPFGGPPVPPVITSISPDDVQAFLPPFVTLGGSGFSTVTSLDVGSVTLTPPGGFTIVSDSSISFTPPAPTSLGAVAVDVTGPAGTSNAVTLTYIESHPPKLSVPSFTFQGLTLNWSYGGGAGDSHYLLYALSPATFEFNGFDILAAFNILFVDALDAIGTGSFGVPIPASAAGITLYSQGVTIDGGGFVGASLVASTVIF